MLPMTIRMFCQMSREVACLPINLEIYPTEGTSTIDGYFHFHNILAKLGNLPNWGNFHYWWVFPFP